MAPQELDTSIRASRLYREFGPRPELADTQTLLYCVGAAKTGTTWLFDQLSTHPQAHLTRKEFHYWNTVRPPHISMDILPMQPILRRLRAKRRRLMSLSRRLGFNVRRAALAWEAILSAPDNHDAYVEMLTLGRSDEKLICDISPAYGGVSRFTYAEMDRLHHNARFIYIMRDPVARMWSHARHRARHWAGEANVGDLALDEFERMLVDPAHGGPRGSRYDLTIAELEAAVPSDRIAYFFYEDLFTQDGADRVADFLGISRFTPKLEVSNKGGDYGTCPDPAQMERAYRLMAPVYDFMQARFGAAIPTKWHRPEAAGAMSVAQGG